MEREGLTSSIRFFLFETSKYSFAQVLWIRYGCVKPNVILKYKLTLIREVNKPS